MASRSPTSRRRREGITPIPASRRTGRRPGAPGWIVRYQEQATTAGKGEIVELEADRFQHLAYDETQFRTETGAVLGEYNKSAANPFLKMWEALSELAFQQHTYSHTTIGYLAKISFGVRAIERQCEPVGPTVARINEQLEGLAGGLGHLEHLAGRDGRE
jgi:hypothetical protein